MAITETTTESWGSRLGGSVKGVLVGLLLFIAGFPVLFLNEGRTVENARAFDEGEGACVPVGSCAEIDQDLNENLVHVTDMASTMDVLSDDEFGISATAIRLERRVEMFQWVESSHTTEKKNLGGSVTRTTTYSYKKEWRATAVSSDNFHDTEKQNPPEMEFAGKTVSATTVTFGPFLLSDRQISMIGQASALAIPTNYVCPVGRAVVRGGTLYVPNAETRNNAKNVRDVVAEPRIGDMRVTFRQILPHKVSIVAKVRGETFVPFRTKNKKTIMMLSDGERSMEEMFDGARSSNALTGWILRLVGILMMYFGLSMVLRPLSVLADVLPILGSIVGGASSIVAGLLALACGLTTIAIAWLYYRPVLAACLFAIVAALLVLMVMRKRKSAVVQMRG